MNGTSGDVFLGGGVSQIEAGLASIVQYYMGTSPDRHLFRRLFSFCPVLARSSFFFFPSNYLFHLFSF